ncbi:MAG: dTDP-4-dehydrorhamnose reductase [Gammaproteobacteria bacterium]|nr:dTDP-4-dehydrorhamnose reductase [Gammaproteobacteria bacterium]
MKFLVAGGAGQLGSDFSRIAISKGHEVVSLSSSDLDISDMDNVHTSVMQHTPDIVLNAAAYTAVDKAESESELAFRINRDGAANLAQVCSRLNIPLIHISTDYVFDGDLTRPYTEGDQANPTGVYGKSKFEGELAVREYCDNHIILRVAWVFGVYGNNFVKTIQRLARERETLKVVADQQGCPTSTRAISMALLQIVANLDKKWGTYHYVCQPATSWHGFAEAVVAETSRQESLAIKELLPITTEEYPTPATRPKNSVLDCTKIKQVFGIEQADWHEELCSVIDELANS